MRRRSIFQWACLWAMATLAPAGWAADCSEPVTLPDKPELSQFADYNTFLVEIMKYKSAKRERAQHRQQCPLAYEEKERPSRNPTVIEGPETLTEALQRAQKIPRLDYSQHQMWYDRTTSRSFPLPDMGRDQLSSNTLRSNLRLMRGDQEPRMGSEWLPGIVNTTLNQGRTNGKEPQLRDWLFFEEWLPEQEARAEQASNDFGFRSRLAFITQVQNDDRGRLRLFIGQTGNSIKNMGMSYSRSCFSSCNSD